MGMSDLGSKQNIICCHCKIFLKKAQNEFLKWSIITFYYVVKISVVI